MREVAIGGRDWLRHVNGMIDPAADKSEYVRSLHKFYRAGGIALMNHVGFKVVQSTDETLLGIRGVTRRASEHSQSNPITTDYRCPDRYAIGMTTTRYTPSMMPKFLSALLGSSADVLPDREHLYVRKLLGTPSDDAPDMRHEAWVLPWSDEVLPAVDQHLGDNKWSCGRFGAEIADLAAGIGYELPRTWEEVEAIELSRG